jgi:hypothetical protein
MTVTSRKTIKHHEANQIASAISNKAMAHILTPLKAESIEAGERAYQAFIADLGLTPEVIAKLEKANILGLNYQCSLYIGERYTREVNHIFIGYGANGDRVRHLGELSQAERDALPKYIDSSLVITGDIAEQLKEETKAYRESLEQAEKLRQEVYNQCFGKSVAAVCKAWPETERIVCQACGVDPTGTAPTNTLTSPLSVLLAQYLPALPAPATVASVSN